MDYNQSFYLPHVLAVITILILFIYYQYRGFRIKNNDDSLIVTQEAATPLYDAFNRQRVSNPVFVFESKQFVNDEPLKWDNKLYSGSGIINTYYENRASTIIGNTPGVSGHFIRQTYRSFDYRPGKSQQIMMTANLLNNYPSNGYAEGVTIRLGNYNDKNGLFFEYDEDTMYCVVRSYVSGSVVDTRVAQRDWNVDKMDGTGKSGIKVSWDKAQIYNIDFAWLGVGRVRFCLILKGIIFVVHEVISANISESVYMSKPSNPLRTELITTTASPGVSTEQICSSVATEDGSGNDIGIIRTQGVSNTINVPADGVNYVLQAFRLKEDNHSTIIPLNVHMFNMTDDNNNTVDTEWSLIFEPILTPAISESSWESVPGASGSLEYFESDATPGISASIGSSTVTISSDFTSSSGKKGGGNLSVADEITQNLLLLGKGISTPTSTGHRQILAITTKNLHASVTADMRSNLTWKEL